MTRYVRNYSEQGFSLIELLIVIAIVAVLMGISYPIYQAHLINIRRNDGKYALINFAASIEKSALMTNTGYQPLPFTVTSPKGYYQLSVIVTDPLHFIALAKPINSQVNDKICGTLAINEQGLKGHWQNGNIVVDPNCW